jgi:adenylate cyclase
VTPRRFTLGLALGLATGVAGALLSLTHGGLGLEERFGLDGLFHLRGPRVAPPEVVVVSIDKASADRFGLPNEPRKWPRQLHARLLDNLSRAGAAVVAFDIHFEEERDPAQDRQFVQAVQRAGNVVLFEQLKKATHSLTDAAGRPTGEVVTERRVPPFAGLAQAAAATAPFPLPKVPVKVSQFWLYKQGAGDAPTLPVVVWQLRTRADTVELLRLLRAASPAAVPPASDAEAMLRAGNLRPVMETLRLLLRQPVLGAQVRAQLAADTTLSSATRKRLDALVQLYQEGDSRYLNYYGPPHSITTLPYYEVWQADASPGAPAPDLRGKIVFVGFSESQQPEQQDGFYTVYSQATSGLDISGVEIAATAVANMLEGNPVRPLGSVAQFVLILGWGLLVGVIAMFWRIGLSGVLLLLLALVYLLVAHELFLRQAVWLPLVVPLAIQAPIALLAGLWWHYRDVGLERNRIRLAFRHYLPERAVAALARDLSAAPGGELMHGVCLATDAAQYSTLAEHMLPQELAQLMNRYYERLFQPVRQHQGFVSDIVGDAMLAVWAQVQPDASQRAQACRAALDVAQAAEGFSQTIASVEFITRLGLHAGPIMLGHIGAVDHFEYRAVGDIVNTAARLQALNKILGTRILASRETTDGLDEFVLRAMGVFRVPGKTKPTAVMELCGYAREATDKQHELARDFAAALEQFTRADFALARSSFERLLQGFPQDGPSHYYLGLCERYLAKPPAPGWDGVVTVADHRVRQRIVALPEI